MASARIWFWGASARHWVRGTSARRYFQGTGARPWVKGARHYNGTLRRMPQGDGPEIMIIEMSTP